MFNINFCRWLDSNQRTSDIGSDRSTNWITTTAYQHCLIMNFFQAITHFSAIAIQNWARFWTSLSDRWQKKKCLQNYEKKMLNNLKNLCTKKWNNFFNKLYELWLFNGIENKQAKLWFDVTNVNPIQLAYLHAHFYQTGKYPT